MWLRLVGYGCLAHHIDISMWLLVLSFLPFNFTVAPISSFPKLSQSSHFSKVCMWARECTHGVPLALLGFFLYWTNNKVHFLILCMRTIPSQASLSQKACKKSRHLRLWWIEAFQFTKCRVLCESNMRACFPFFLLPTKFLASFLHLSCFPMSCYGCKSSQNFVFLSLRWLEDILTHHIDFWRYMFSVAFWKPWCHILAWSWCITFKAGFLAYIAIPIFPIVLGSQNH